MPIGDRAEVRDLTGITDIIDLPDSRIDTALVYGRGELYALTFKTDWDTDTVHPLYNKAKMIVELFAAYWILIRYVGFTDKARLFREQLDIVTEKFKTEYNEYQLVTDPTGGGGTSSKFSLVASKYKSFPLNPDAEVSGKSTVIIPGD